MMHTSTYENCLQQVLAIQRHNLTKLSWQTWEYQSEKDVPTMSSRKKKRMSMIRRRVILEDRDMAAMMIVVEEEESRDAK